MILKNIAVSLGIPVAGVVVLGILLGLCVVLVIYILITRETKAVSGTPYFFRTDCYTAINDKFNICVPTLKENLKAIKLVPSVRQKLRQVFPEKPDDAPDNENGIEFIGDVTETKMREAEAILRAEYLNKNSFAYINSTVASMYLFTVSYALRSLPDGRDVMFLGFLMANISTVKGKGTFIKYPPQTKFHVLFSKDAMQSRSCTVFECPTGSFSPIIQLPTNIPTTPLPTFEPSWAPTFEPSSAPI